MKTVKKYLKRYFVDGMSAMALGLFSSLIIGLILQQLGRIPHCEFFSYAASFVFGQNASGADMAILGASSPVIGAAIGGAIAYGLKHKPLVIFSSIAVGAFSYALGGPAGAFVAVTVAAELGGLIAGKTKIDIILVPMLTIVSGGLVGKFVGPGISWVMSEIGNFLNYATELHPLPMGIIIAVVVGLALTAPISSAALCIMIGLSGLAGGAAVVGCSAQMIGFAVASFKDNKFGGLISQGIGTSMLQVGNIMKHPQILLAPTLAGAVLGPISTCVLKMQCTPTGAGMGTSGLVGQFGTWDAMKGTMPLWQLILEIVIMHFVAPAVLALAFHFLFKKIGWVKDGYQTLKSE